MGKRSFKTGFKRGFLKGLVVLLPTALTLILLIQVYKFVQDTIGAWINARAEGLLEWVGLDAFFLQWKFWSRTVPGPDGAAIRQVDVPDLFGFVVAILAVCFVGSFFASYLGRKLLPVAEGVLHRIPIFKVVYPYAKQVTDFFLEEKKSRYDMVVAVPYPREGIYSIGFLTGEGMKAVSSATGIEMVNVFIPSSPTPITGYAIFVDPKEIIRLDLTVDQALRFIISGGVIIPPAQVQTLRKPKEALIEAPTQSAGLPDASKRPRP